MASRLIARRPLSRISAALAGSGSVSANSKKASASSMAAIILSIVLRRDPVSAHRRGFRWLQFARPVVGFFLVRPGAALGHLGQQLVDVGRGDLRHQLPAPDGCHQLGQCRPLVGRIALRQLWQMLGAIAFDQIADARGLRPRPRRPWHGP